MTIESVLVALILIVDVYSAYLGHITHARHKRAVERKRTSRKVYRMLHRAGIR